MISYAQQLFSGGHPLVRSELVARGCDHAACDPLQRAGACKCARDVVVVVGGGTCFVSAPAVAGGQAPAAQARASYFLRMNTCVQLRPVWWHSAGDSFQSTGAADFQNTSDLHSLESKRGGFRKHRI